MFRELKHKRKLREIERARELIQARCNHSWRYIGVEIEEINAGSSVETMRQNAYECLHCRKIKLSY